MVGQVFYPHHSNQMSQRSNFIESLFEVVLKMSLNSSFSKKKSVLWMKVLSVWGGVNEVYGYWRDISVGQSEDL